MLYCCYKPIYSAAATYYLFFFLFLELNIPLDDNRLKEAKTIVFEYADSKLPRQGNEEQPPNVNQQRLHSEQHYSERPPSEVVQAIGKFSHHTINKICSKSRNFYTWLFV